MMKYVQVKPNVCSEAYCKVWLFVVMLLYVLLMTYNMVLNCIMSAGVVTYWCRANIIFLCISDTHTQHSGY